jgi:hypothetical protein
MPGVPQANGATVGTPLAIWMDIVVIKSADVAT